MTYTVVGAVILAALALAAVQTGARVYAPIPVYCGTWSGVLALYALSANAFAPLDALGEDTVLFLVSAALVFTAGSAAASWRSRTTAHQPELFALRRSALEVILVLFVITVPAVYWRVSTLLAGIPLDQVLYFARNVDVDPSRLGITSLLGPYSNAIPLSIALTLLLYALPAPARFGWLRSVILVATLGIQLSTGARGGIVALLIGVVGLSAMHGELKWGKLLVLCGVFFLFFFGIGLLVKKGGASLDASPAENARASLQGLRDYAVGGLLAFQRVLRHPGEVPSTGGIARTAQLMLNGLGAHFPPVAPPEYTTIGERVDTNVYTAYFNYVEYGLPATVALVFASGFIIAAVYARALAGSAMARAVYATFLAAMVLSVFGEGFYTNINFLGKLLICGALLLKRVKLPDINAHAVRTPA